MASVETNGKIRLDWSKLLGFDQSSPVEASSKDGRRAVSGLTKLGAKVGNKAGTKARVEIS